MLGRKPTRLQIEQVDIDLLDQLRESNARKANAEVSEDNRDASSSGRNRVPVAPAQQSTRERLGLPVEPTLRAPPPH